MVLGNMWENLYAIPLKIPLPMGMWMPFNALFLRPTRVHIQNSILIGSAIFAELRIMTDHAPPSVVIGHVS